jgi:hypothetical protein
MTANYHIKPIQLHPHWYHIQLITWSVYRLNPNRPSPTHNSRLKPFSVPTGIESENVLLPQPGTFDYTLSQTVQVQNAYKFINSDNWLNFSPRDNRFKIDHRHGNHSQGFTKIQIIKLRLFFLLLVQLCYQKNCLILRKIKRHFFLVSSFLYTSFFLAHPFTSKHDPFNSVFSYPLKGCY